MITPAHLGLCIKQLLNALDLAMREKNGQANKEARTKWFEVAVTALGLVVTATLGYGQWRLGQQQNLILESQAAQQEQRAVNQIEIQVMSLVSEHLGYLGSANDRGQTAERIVSAAADYLSEEFGRTSLAMMARKIAEEQPEVSEPVQFRLAEATQPPPQLAKVEPVEGQPHTASQNWYAVIASLPSNRLENAKLEANKKYDQAKKLGFESPIQLYRTKISNNIAIVIGGSIDQATARSLAADARSTGLAGDAFPQIDREWSFVGEAPFVIYN